jgi:hypothetical protein
MLRRALDDAALIIPAFGYVPNLIPVFDGNSNEIILSAKRGGPMVNKRCRITDELGAEIPGMFGIGLASGFVPSGKLGGEPGFRGQTNGMWLYQNGVGEIIFDEIMNTDKLLGKKQKKDPQLSKGLFDLLS